MKTNLKRNVVSAIVLFACIGWPTISAIAQKVEVVQEISKKAVKGYLYETLINDNNNIELVYKIKSGKDKVVYEVYEFDQALKFIGKTELETKKSKYKEKPELTGQYVGASVGGSNSFNILSGKLNLYSVSYKKTWDAERQRYEKKITKREDIKAKNAENKNYFGNVEYQKDDGSLILLASSSKSDKEDQNKQYSLIKVNKQLEMEELPISFDRAHILVYSMLVANGEEKFVEDENEISDKDMMFIFAPLSGNLNEYTFIQYTNDCKERYRFTAALPKNITVINVGNSQPDGTIYLAGLSIQSKKTFDNVIGEWAPIQNFGYIQYGIANYKMEKFEKNTEKTEFEDFVTIKIKNGKLVWITPTPIKEFKSILKTPPSQKKGYSFDGKRFIVKGFKVLPDESFIVNGQVKLYVFKQEPNNINYKDLVCFRIDKTGKVVAQFSYAPEVDKKSLIYPVPQFLNMGQDKNYLYWTNFETKVVKGYSSFTAAYYGVATLYPNYVPSVGKIDLSNNTISNFDIMGNRKFLLNNENMIIELPDGVSKVFVGEDKKGKVMLAKYSFK